MSRTTRGADILTAMQGKANAYCYWFLPHGLCDPFRRFATNRYLWLQCASLVSPIHATTPVYLPTYLLKVSPRPPPGAAEPRKTADISTSSMSIKGFNEQNIFAYGTTHFNAIKLSIFCIVITYWIYNYLRKVLEYRVRRWNE